MMYPAVRWLSYLALFLIIGATAFRVWIVPRVTGSDPEHVRTALGRAVLCARLASVVLAMVILVKLYLQARSMIEPEEALSYEILQLVVGSPWGRGWLAQGTAALAAMIGWRAMARRVESPWALGLIVSSAVGLVLAAPLTGHAVGLPAAGRLGYPATVVHVAAGALWLGTLGIVLLGVIRPARPTLPIGPVIRAFSGVALPAGLLTIACGVLVAWRYVGAWAPLFSTDYGTALLIKTGIAFAIAGIGGYNWRFVLPRLETSQTTPLSRSASIETFLGILLLAVTAVLVSLGAPSDLAE